MCLGIPGRIVQVLDGFDGQLAMVDVLGQQRQVNIGMLEEEQLTAGDWIVIHMGFAMERVDEAAAREALIGLELMGQARQAAPAGEGSA